MADNVTRVLGIDTSLRSTGFAVVEARGSAMKALEYGTIRSRAGDALSACLRRLYESIQDVTDRATPVAAAIETAFFHKNIRTTMVLGEARGAAITACAKCGLPIYEYEPRRVKQAVVGFGGAGKQQVRKMVMSLLSLRDAPAEDASDALAIAICHLHTRTGHAVLMSKEI